jgi:ectoine hydroxylase-related dioxygenase (phytanoyl-CoA dioxygenase family)
VDNIAKFLKVEPGDVSISEPMCRLDVPDDKRNALEWHQERSFFPQNRDGLHSLVCWIPLTDVTEEMGAIHISPESHTSGLLVPTQNEKKSELSTRQISVPEEYVKKYEDLVVTVHVGDVVFFNMLLFHRSGVNISDKVRFSVQSRFHTATADDFIPFELINYYNPDIKQKLIEKNYDCSDIPDNIRQPPIARKS